MPDSTILEIGLGLLLVFVLFSLLVSAALEMIVALFKSRAAGLWDGVGMLLQNNEALRSKFFNHPLVKSLTPPQSWGVSLTSDRRSIPSYIEPRTFALVLLDLLKEPHKTLGAVEAELTRTVKELRAGDTSGLKRASAALEKASAALPDTPLGAEIDELKKQLDTAGKTAAELTKDVEKTLAALPAHLLAALETSAAGLGLQDTIRALAEDAADSIENFRKGVERWFDEGMARVTGWYKRWTQAVQLGLALALAVALNVDSINIVRTLGADDELRRAIAAQAEAYARTAVLEPRSVSGEASSGPFKVTLHPDGEAFERFELRSELPSELPSGADLKNVVSVKPSDELKKTSTEGNGGDFVVKCDDARPGPPDAQPPVAVIPCRGEQVSARKSGSIQITFAWADNTKKLTETSSVPIVLVPDAEKQFEEIQRRLRETGLPIGWAGVVGLWGVWSYIWEHGGLPVLGWLITALAASLGAPFWFDLLKKVANIRASGPSPSTGKK